MTVQPQSQSSPALIPARRVPRLVTLQLYARSGGHCQFRGCPANLLEHAVTKRAGNFAEQAHIWAFSKDGPRGSEAGRPADIHSVENLMLLCAPCHKQVDDAPDVFTVPLLRTFKEEHEGRIRRAVALSPEFETVILTMAVPIRGARITISRTEVLEAVAPRYPSSSTFTSIDLNDLIGQAEDPSFLDVACKRIDREIERLFDHQGPIAQTPRLAVFALAPIPLLAYLGARLENKVPLTLYQKHRGPQNWCWKTSGPAFAYGVRAKREKPRGAPVALVLSLSGTIDLADLPADVRENAAIYEITVDGIAPNPTFLNRAEDLAAFIPAFHGVIGRIAAEHGYVDAIDVFPAVPAPVAVLLGRERLMKRHPALRIHDADRKNGGFQFQIEVN